MADKVIREHYVPQRYLKYFANNERFYVYDKEKLEPRPGNIGDYACERYFYDIDFYAIKNDILESNPNFSFDPIIEKQIQTLDPQHIEHWFANNVEDWLFKPIDKIITTYTMYTPSHIESIPVLTETEINYLSLYMALQVIRTKEFRESLTELYERLPQLLIRKLTKPQEDHFALDSFNIKVPTENHKKVLHSEIITDPVIVANLALTFRGKLWVIGYNDSNIPFVTSDHPVVKHGHLGLHGFNSLGAEVCFPLSPNLILLLFDPGIFGSRTEIHNHFTKVLPNEVTFYNSLQAAQCYRYFFEKRGQFDSVKDFLNNNPQLQNIKHNRFLLV